MFNRVNIQVKICGITQPQQGVEIAALGANHLGFICVPQSPRYLAPAGIAAVVRALAAAGYPSTNTIGVFANATPDAIAATVEASGLTGIQLHGAEPPALCQHIRQRFPHTTLIKALRVKDAATLATAQAYAPWVDALLLDAYHPDQLGGTGHTLDWEALRGFRPPCPWWLAGGLNPDNVATALALTQPDGIDLSSGVEVHPGVKDLARVQELFTRLAAAAAPA